MKFLNSSKMVGQEMSRLIKNYKKFSWAVAWASMNDYSADFLADPSKFEKVIVGTNFNQTDPDFIRKAIDEPNIKFNRKNDGVFHPKLYLFENNSKDWECIIGSPNFTKSAFGKNLEMAILISDKDNGSIDVYTEIKRTINHYWENSETLKKDDLDLYEKGYKTTKQLSTKMSGLYDGLGRPVVKSPYDIKFLKMNWHEYYSEIIKNDSDYRERIKLIAIARELFKKRFAEMSHDDRDKLAGLVKKKDGLDWFLFGNLRGDAYIAIRNNFLQISKALDFIPITGKIEKVDYDRYYEEIKKAFPGGGAGIATVTRLLAMKRPDYFLSLNKMSLDKFSKEFGILSIIRPENYWDTVVEQIKKCYWWDSIEPSDKEEKEIWGGRAAFLDSLFYYV